MSLLSSLIHVVSTVRVHRCTEWPRLRRFVLTVLTYPGSTDAGSALTRLPTALAAAVAALPVEAAMAVEAAVATTVEAAVAMAVDKEVSID
jgi:hypothetical protein